MKVSLNKSLLVLMGLILLILIAVFVQNRSVHYHEHNDRLNLLRDLRNLNSELDQQLISLTQAADLDAYTYASTLNALENMREQMLDHAGRFYRDLPESSQALLTQYWQTHQTKLEQAQAIQRLLNQADADTFTAQAAAARQGYFALNSRSELNTLEIDYQAHVNSGLRNADLFSMTLLLLTTLLMLLMGDLLRRLQDTGHRAEKNRQRLQDAVNSLDAGFALFDQKGQRILSNQRWDEFYPWLKATPDYRWSDLAQLHREHLTCQTQDQTPGSEHRVVEYTHLGRWLQVSDTPTAEGGIVSIRTDISEAQSTQLELRKMGRALQQSPTAVVITDTRGIIETLNPKMSEMTGYSPEELIGQDVALLRSGDMDPEIYQDLWQTLKQGKEWRGEMLNRRKNGELFWDASIISPLRNEQGEVTHYIAVKEDITLRKHAEEQLRMIAAVFDTSNEAIMIAGRDGTIKAVNPAFTRITGYTQEEALGRNPNMLSSGRHDHLFYEQMWHSLTEKGEWSGEIWNRRKNGNVYPEWLSISTLRDEEGQICDFVSVFSDITQRKKDEAHIRHQAYYDALTQLPNRNLLLDRLEVALVTADRDQHVIALLFVDLDRFKNVNDTLGHEQGDELLQQVATRLSQSVRESDTVARFGGDEFVVLLHNIHSDRDAALIAEKIIRQLSSPFNLAGREIFIGASIGITLYPGDAETPEALVRNADLAMYQAKQTGRNCFRFFTSSLQEHANTLMEMEQDLRLALDQNQLEVFYQPLVRTLSGKITGVEALLRWRHPTRGMIPPDQFIPLAEDTGLIGPIGLWILETTCRQVKAWRDQGHQLYLSVNISGRQRDLGLDAESLQQILHNTELPADQLVLEITEGMLLDDSDETIVWLRAFKDLGVHLAIDDFGTGYSSLSYLKRFPIDTLKIDREFIRDLTLDNEDALLVEAIISMAHSLKLRLIAEGVETAEQRCILYQLGCGYLQGFHFARPMPAIELQDWLVSYSPQRLQLG
ncbi:sensor domain-containing protein [Nitrincola tapanii]|uniref:cyclic-guanylate-specific phosphodiesterase n=1 Tax=Nitrincola tapanii TaxID=1708751 RepID=A0A5A9W3K6_9GAMM|nr:EAL domain-containing protein [Nitrincola tapanii]KAA0874131.1 EAL domain-containing protein [Nitrincola tapanii]